MKESLIIIAIFFAYTILFKLLKINIIQLDFKINLIIFLSYLTSFIFLIDRKNCFFSWDFERIKKALIEFNIFLIFSLIYSFLMSNVFSQQIFNSYCESVLVFYPLINLFYMLLLCFGYKETEDYFIYGNKKLLILKSLVKIFFTPFIYGSVCICLGSILLMERISLSNIDHFFYLIGLTVDVVIALFGYLFGTRLLNNQIKSVDESLKGWVICIICYPPFLYFYKILLSQVDNFTWSDWARGEWWYYPWLFMVVITWLLYWFSHAHFGVKFSNLTWRGLIDTGLYKFVKHPAYLSKNVYWWLYTVPLFGVVGLDLVQNICALMITNVIYYLRAKTEEAHLLKFPEYQQYCEWMENNGLWAKCKRFVFI